MAVPLSEVEPLVVTGMDRARARSSSTRGWAPLRLGLLGRHQAANAASATAALDALGAAGIATVDDAAIRAGLEGATWPGRLELLPASPSRPQVLLDGAHNEAGAPALADAVDELAPGLAGGRATLLLGILRDKEVAAIIDALATSRGAARRPRHRHDRAGHAARAPGGRARGCLGAPVDQVADPSPTRTLRWARHSTWQARRAGRSSWPARSTWSVTSGRACVDDPDTRDPT